MAMIAKTSRTSGIRPRPSQLRIQIVVGPSSTSFFDWNADQVGPLCAAFAASTRCHHRQTCLIAQEQAWTYAEIANAATEIAARLRGLSRFEQGDRVVLLCGNSPEYVAGFYGILLAGGVVVPLPADIEADRLERVLNSTGSRIIFTRTGREGRNSLVLRNAVADSWSLTGSEPHRSRGQSIRSGDELAAIYFTSGSTGEPKGVMLSENNLLSNATAVAQSLELGDDERALAVLPFCHAFGNSVLQSHLLTGGSLILDGSPAFPTSMLEALVKHQATSFSAVPELFHMLLRHTDLRTTPLPCLRYMSVAGGALQPETVRQMQSAIAPAKFFVMYGQTEATARLSYLPPESLPAKAGSIGRGIPGTCLEVVDSAGLPVPAGVVGALRARGPGVMLGYWNDKVGTRRVLRDGWLSTGDLAVRDAEGFIYPRGRENNLMKVFGHRVHPVEIEQLIEERFAVDRAVAVPFEDEEYRIRIALFIQPQAAGADETLVRQILTHCRRNLPSYKVPAYVEAIERVPLNEALKLDRNRLTHWAQQRFSGQSRSTA